ncbi:hypothetical protein DYB37_006555 [Aphanomyces astaci]|uniref:DNA/RNA-binding protein Alba-like domain-containing protein n=1 Tax=Aphanomyces astaci TaxID=112090 RepID=A0A418F7V0_APHAT|nr:hypothetical protein DYB37_006555 [Aphanomyces astaci]
MDKYRRGEKKATDQDAATLPNEVRITKFGNVHGYVSYATNLLTPADKATTSGDIVLKAMGNAISKAVTVAEILKHRIPNIHTVTNILSVETEDVYEPLEEGLDVVTTVRRIPSISIQLALNVSLVNLNASGYQKPIPVDQVNPESDGVTHVYDGDDSRQTRGGGRGRKPRGRSGRGGGRGRGGDVAVEEGETAAVGGYAAESGENGESRAPKARRARAKKNVVTASGAPEVSENLSTTTHKMQEVEVVAVVDVEIEVAVDLSQLGTMPKSNILDMLLRLRQKMERWRPALLFRARERPALRVLVLVAVETAVVKASGFINLHKPSGLTSHDCVAKLRRILRTKRVGHAGTLDPMATGVLPIAVNRATKFIQVTSRSTSWMIVDIIFAGTFDLEPIESCLPTSFPTWTVDATTEARWIGGMSVHWFDDIASNASSLTNWPVSETSRLVSVYRHDGNQFLGVTTLTRTNELDRYVVTGPRVIVEPLE